MVDDEGNITTPAQTLTRIETEYSYPVASDGKTTTRLEKFINKTYNGNSTSAIAYTLLNIRTFTIIGLSFSAAELLTNKSMYYRNRVK